VIFAESMVQKKNPTDLSMPAPTLTFQTPVAFLTLSPPDLNSNRPVFASRVLLVELLGEGLIQVRL